MAGASCGAPLQFCWCLKAWFQWQRHHDLWSSDCWSDAKSLLCISSQWVKCVQILAETTANNVRTWLFPCIQEVMLPQKHGREAAYANVKNSKAFLRHCRCFWGIVLTNGMDAQVVNGVDEMSLNNVAVLLCGSYSEKLQATRCFFKIVRKDRN